MDLEFHKDTLTRFAQEHLTGDSAKDNFIKLKLAHSLHVFKNGQRIAEGEKFPPHTSWICHIASLYHDIGRFPQFARYGTFNDRESINHGRLGVLTLRDTSIPGNISEPDMRLIRLAIGQHNLKSIRPNVPEPYATPIKTVRDADKIDIFRVMIDHFSGDNPDPVVTHGFEDIPDKYTPEIYQSVMLGQVGDYANIRYANDFKLLLIGWLEDLNYKTSLDIIVQRGDVDKLFSFLPKDECIEVLKQKVDTFIRYNC